MMHDNEWFENGVGEVSSSQGDGPLPVFDDSQIIEETHTGVVVGWMIQSLTKRLDQSARSSPQRRPLFDIAQSDPEPRNPRLDASPSDHRCRQRQVGWSLVMAAFSIVSLALVTIATGSTTVGVVACGGLAFSVCGLVAAEIVSRY